MNLKQFKNVLNQSPENLQFADCIELIESLYNFTPCAFINGSIENSADENQGACKIFAFGIAQDLDKTQALLCFGEHYRAVLKDPEGSEHANIRQFMKSGWESLSFDDNPLSPKPFSSSSIGFG